MKKINSVTLETMEKELAVLDEANLRKIKGGHINTNWSCFFDSLETIGNRMGVSNDANYYYQEFKNEFGYDPAKITGYKEPAGTNPLYPSNNTKAAIYKKVDHKDYVNAMDHFGFSASESYDYENTSGTQMLLIPQGYDEDGNPQYHAVVGEAYLESGMIRYTDSANNTTGTVNPLDSGFIMYNVRRKS